jgi:hypothetical protein
MAQKKNKAVAASSAREECYCMGLQHPVLGNCLSCGKIVCELEGAGQPCTFCGVVFTPASSNSSNNNKAAFAEAVARKNALLEYERKSVARSLIYDDQGDYFNSDSQWMSQEEKTKLRSKEKELRDQKQKQKRGVKITLDIFGRRMIVTEDQDANKSIYQPFNLADIMPPKQEEEAKQEPSKLSLSGTTALRPTYQKPVSEERPAAATAASKSKVKSGNRVQHAYFEVEDDANANDNKSAAAFFPFFGVCFDGCAPHLKDADSFAVVDQERFDKDMQNVLVRARYPLAAAAQEQLFELIKSDAVKAVVLDFSESSTPGEDRFNTLAKYHAHLVSEAVSCKSDKGMVEIWVLPYFNRLRADGDYTPARKYWNELNETVRRNVAFVLCSSSDANPIISKEHVKTARAAFGDKRSLVLFDTPTTPFSCYTGRHFGLELKGLFVTTNGLHPKADSISVASALAFQRRPASFDAAESFKQVVAAALGEEVTRDCKEARYLLEVSQFVPKLVRDKTEIDAMRRQLLSRRRLEEIQETCRLLRESQVLKGWLQDEFSVLEDAVLKPVEELCEACKSSAVVLAQPARTGVVQKKKGRK